MSIENPQSNFNKWFRTEVAVAFTIGSVVAGILTYFMNPVNELKTNYAVLQSQVDNIKNNDLVHIFESQVKTETKIEEIQKQQVINTTQLEQILQAVNKK